MRLQKSISLVILALACVLAHALIAAEPKQPRASKRGGAKPAPDLKDVKYGPHERNLIDLWQAKSDHPAPLVVFIHGGAFRAGDKSALAADLLDKCLRAGISVAAINYRLSPEVVFPAHFMDCARAIQFARFKAPQWNLDPQRIAATGGSAGACTSLWIGFHDDLADPKSDDPVQRQSTRLTCMAVQGAQSSVDPRVIKKWIGGRTHEHPGLPGFYGLKPDEIDTPKAYELYEKASPINYVSADDPPVFLFYSEPKGPLPPNAKPGQGIHHFNFGVALKQKLDPLGIECVLRHADDYRAGGDVHEDMVKFLLKHFAAGKAAEKPVGTK